MSVSRRKFLRTGAVVSAALVFKPSTFIFGSDAITSNSVLNNEAGIRSYSREMFEPYIGDVFRVRVGKQVVDLKLVALTNIGPAYGRTRTDCFSLKFHGAKPLPATVHTMNHSKLGDFDLFMVQTKDKARFLQTAIVNHLL